MPDLEVSCLRCGCSYVLAWADRSITERTSCPTCAYLGWTSAAPRDSDEESAAGGALIRIGPELIRRLGRGH